MSEPTAIKAGYLESLWKFFASVRLTVIVLLALAILSIIGTLVPQNQNPADYFRAFSPFAYQLMATLDIFDMYHSWWFQGLIAMLVVNIVICSVDRLQNTWGTIFPKTRQFNLQTFRQRKSRLELKLQHKSDTLQSPFLKCLSKAFRYCRLVPTDEGFALTAEKGRWTRLGVYGVHLSIVVLLIGGLIGSRFGFEGYVNIPEGQTADTIELTNIGASFKLPFTVRCDEFNVQYYEGGKRPKEFRSSLTILENNTEVMKKDIIVNNPLRYKGINIYQSSFGEMDRPRIRKKEAADPQKEVELSFRSNTSGMIYEKKASIGQVIQLPEGLGDFVLESYEPEAEFKTMALGPTFIGTLTPQGGPAEKIKLPVNFPKFDTMRQGTVAISIADAGNVSPEQKWYFTGLQVAYDPGVILVYTGFIMMIAGCFVAFFMSHQQVVVEVTAKGEKSYIMISGTANKNKLGFRQKLHYLAKQLEDLVAKSEQDAIDEIVKSHLRPKKQGER